MTKPALLAAFPVMCLLASLLSAQTAGRIEDPLAVRPTDRMRLRVDETRRVTLSGQRHQLARPEFAIGDVAPDHRMERMVLVLEPDADQERALEALIQEQQNPGSPLYHQWLSPEAFGERFGISERDLNQVTNWLQRYGLAIEEIPSSRRTIVFSGTAAQVSSAFHTAIRTYSVGGAVHYANATDPEIPQALAGVVRGAVSLHNFESKPAIAAAPAYTAANGAHFLAPRDWAKIYDVDRLYSLGLDGAGQSIAVIGRIDIDLKDVRTFRANAGLPANDPQIIVNGEDPGTPWCEDEAESTLDVEWAGAIAKNATIKFVTSKSGATDGINLSAQYAVTHNVAPILTVSYGLCEEQLGPAGNAFWNGIWAQAAAQGISVFVSSGDSGAAGCDSLDDKVATHGRGVNGICSSPHATCVGATQFADTMNSGAYWADANGSGMSSVLGYIPEVAWNDSAWSGNIGSSGGGASTLYSKPSWQTGPGVPGSAMRLVPDISAAGAYQDAYVTQIQGNIFYMTGTSAATPSLAGVLALVLQDARAPQGNINPVLYALAQRQSLGGGAVFHDVTSGNNSVPGVAGYQAGAGYDAVTGLGSVDAFLLLNHWREGSAAYTALPGATPPPDMRRSHKPIQRGQTQQAPTP